MLDILEEPRGLVVSFSKPLFQINLFLVKNARTHVCVFGLTLIGYGLAG